MRLTPSLRSFLPENASGRIVSGHLRVTCRQSFSASASRCLFPLMILA